jgi:hypothetical protein
MDPIAGRTVLESFSITSSVGLRRAGGSSTQRESGRTPERPEKDVEDVEDVEVEVSITVLYNDAARQARTGIVRLPRASKGVQVARAVPGLGSAVIAPSGRVRVRALES